MDFLSLFLGAVQAITTLFGANDNNKNVEKAEESAKRSAAIDAKQLKDKAAQEAALRLRDARAIRGRALAAAGETGFSVGSFGDVITANDIQTGLNLDTLDQNLRLQLQRVDSGLEADLTALDSRNISPLSALTGAVGSGVSGYNTGLSIQNNYNRYTEKPKP